LALVLSNCATFHSILSTFYDLNSLKSIPPPIPFANFHAILSDMKEAKSPSVKIINNAKAADTLINPKTLLWLEPFLANSTTISEAAKRIASKPNTVLSRVRKLLRLGLLKVVKEEKRAGRAIKWYRSSSDSFFVPFAATSAESLEEMMAERDSYWESMLRAAVVRSRMESIGTWGTRFYKDQLGHL